MDPDDYSHWELSELIEHRDASAEQAVIQAAHGYQKHAQEATLACKRSVRRYQREIDRRAMLRAKT